MTGTHPQVPEQLLLVFGVSGIGCLQHKMSQFIQCGGHQVGLSGAQPVRMLVTLGREGQGRP